MDVRLAAIGSNSTFLPNFVAIATNEEKQPQGPQVPEEEHLRNR